jgi:hypothetical protein
MADFAPDAFALFFNLNQDRRNPGQYWSIADLPIAELRKLSAWVDEQVAIGNTTSDRRGDKCVQVRLNLLPRQSKAGNDYLLGIMKDNKPSPGGGGRNNFDDEVPF